MNVGSRPQGSPFHRHPHGRLALNLWAEIGQPAFADLKKQADKGSLEALFLVGILAWHFSSAPDLLLALRKQHASELPDVSVVIAQGLDPRDPMIEELVKEAAELGSIRAQRMLEAVRFLGSEPPIATLPGDPELIKLALSIVGLQSRMTDPLLEAATLLKIPGAWSLRATVAGLHNGELREQMGYLKQGVLMDEPESKAAIANLVLNNPSSELSPLTRNIDLLAWAEEGAEVLDANGLKVFAERGEGRKARTSAIIYAIMRDQAPSATIHELREAADFAIDAWLRDPARFWIEENATNVFGMIVAPDLLQDADSC
jgi:hypothetical protein